VVDGLDAMNPYVGSITLSRPTRVSAAVSFHVGVVDSRAEPITALMILKSTKESIFSVYRTLISRACSYVLLSQ